MKKFIALFISISLFGNLFSQETFPTNGAPNNNHNYYAFTNAKIYVDYQTVIDKGTLLIKDGKIVQAAATVTIPKGTVVYDLKGKSIYPSLIEMYSSYGMPEVKKGERNFGAPQMESNTKGAYGWNQSIKPETDAYKTFSDDAKAAEELRKIGFGSALTSQKDGIARGTATLVTLAEDRENNLIIKDKVAALYSFNKGNSTQDYPSSLMGSIALLRQTYYDAMWYKNLKEKKEYNISLESFNGLQNLPQIFETRGKLNALRADKLGDEFGVQYIIKGLGDEYQRIDEMKNTRASFIVPINYPAAYDVEDPFDAALVSYDDMKNWEMAPTNLAALEKAGINFAITSSDLKEKKDFWKNIRKAIELGLTEKQALKSLTNTPAELLAVADKVGSLKSGMLANFIITSGNLFEEKNIIYENWVSGNPYKINDYNLIDVRGNYDLKIGTDKNYAIKVSGEVDKPKANIMVGDSAKGSMNLSVSGNLVSLNFTPKGEKGTIRLSGTVAENPMRWYGKGQLANGDWVDWNATFKSAVTNDAKADTAKKKTPVIGDVIYPFTAYGYKKGSREQQTILIKNATIWTNEKEGILKNTDVLLQGGKIVSVGQNISAPAGAKIIDGTGKHLSAGVIDEHSHIALDAVNEGAQASSAEVRQGDVINSEDVNIYRQLSGGVVASQLLHGSANPIGGQSALIKLRWGKSPEEMKIQGADGYIKFALGENVKQSNWGDFNTIRFPQTRMGVEQLYYDFFTRAREYDNKMKAYNAAKGKISAPRRDLELETLAEILNKKRFITCHSYVQSEINMLMHVGDSMGFRVNTFTHILEGYKMADKMKAHGVGASSFSDWWAYKMEVRDAIPYNGAILHDMGVVTAFNSDDAEMARRLNQEAAKAVKYGNISEEEALKFVTLNPAKLLHLDNQMGSIKVGKSADVVLWTDNPLSVYAKADKTIIDGVVYFDSDEDLKMREEMKKEKARLMQKMLDEKNGGGKTQKPEMKKQRLLHCDTMEE